MLGLDTRDESLELRGRLLYGLPAAPRKRTIQRPVSQRAVGRRRLGGCVHFIGFLWQLVISAFCIALMTVVLLYLMAA